jgi:hypothetical protein
MGQEVQVEARKREERREEPGGGNRSGRGMSMLWIKLMGEGDSM